jgi:hypothetical protein
VIFLHFFLVLTLFATVSEEINTGKDVLKKEHITRALFGDHYPRLRELKKRFDPELVFSRWNAIAPA